MVTPAPEAIVFAIYGPIARDDLPGLCGRVRGLLQSSGAAVALCDVGSVDPDAVTVDALARLQVAARRYRCQVRLRHASSELLELLEFMGLRDVLPDQAGVRDEFSTPVRSYARIPLLPRGGPVATTTSRLIFVNLAVEDLGRSVDFFTTLGFTFDPRFTDEHATCMIVSEQAFVMLLVKNRFQDFTKKALVDSTAHTEAIVALSAESREEVDELADRALEAGGTAANDPIEMDFMYGRSFQDPDGHLWELIWMDPSALEQ